MNLGAPRHLDWIGLFWNVVTEPVGTPDRGGFQVIYVTLIPCFPIAFHRRIA